MDKLSLNNQIVLCRPAVRKAKVCIIRKKIKKINILKQCKKAEDREKKLQKAERMLEEIQIMKKVREDDVTKFALLNKDISAIIAKTQSNDHDHVYATLASYPDVQKQIEKTRGLFLWENTLPILLETLGERTMMKKCKIKGSVMPVPAFVSKSTEDMGDDANKPAEDVDNSKKSTEVIADNTNKSLKDVTEDTEDSSDDLSNFTEDTADETNKLNVKMSDKKASERIDVDNASKRKQKLETPQKAKEKVKALKKRKVEDTSDDVSKLTEDTADETNKLNVKMSDEKESERIDVDNTSKRKQKFEKPQKTVKKRKVEEKEEEDDVVKKDLKAKVPDIKKEEAIKVVDSFFVDKKVIQPKLLSDEQVHIERKEIIESNKQWKLSNERKPLNQQDSTSNWSEGKPYSRGGLFEKSNDNSGKQWKTKQTGFSKTDSKFSNERNAFGKSRNWTEDKRPARNDPPMETEEKLHPSWAAKKAQVVIKPFQGKKIKFDD